MPQERIVTHRDLLTLLDGLLQDRGGAWWDSFFHDRTKPCPFFVEWPSESLVARMESGRIAPARVLELGCGHGRNAVYLARQGCAVDAIDFSERAIAWAREMSEAAKVDVNFICGSIFDAPIAPRAYDLVYDSGCFHHLPPHRRPAYIELVTGALRSGGHFALDCFAPEGGSSLTDREVYEQRKLGGGLGYTEEDLRHIFSPAFEIVELRRMEKKQAQDELFGEPFLWTVLMRLREDANGVL